MAFPSALRRLLRVLDLEEEQRRIAVESAQGELARLENSMEAAGARTRHGRRLIKAGAQSGECEERLAGMIETSTGERHTAALTPRVGRQKDEVSLRRAQFLSKRVERRQAETLITQAESAATTIAARRSQQSLDDWHLNHLHAKKRGTWAEPKGSVETPPAERRQPENET